MIITNIRPFFFDLPGAGSIQGYSWNRTSHILVAIEADNQLWGLGEGTPYLEGSFENLNLISALRKHLLDTPIENSRRFLSKLQRKFMQFNGFDYAAFLALDSALIDIISHPHHKSYSKILGGEHSQSHPVYGTVFLDEEEKMIQQSLKWWNKGVRSFKIKISGNEKKDLKKVEGIINAIGKTDRIRVDANGSFKSVSTALSVLQSLQKLGVSEVEQPFPPGSLASCRKIRESLEMKILLDEEVTDRIAIERIWKSKSADGIHIHPSKFGCLEITKENIDLARKLGMEWSLGASGMTSIGASMHLALLDSYESVEYPAEEIGHFEQYGCDIVSNPLQISNGKIELSPLGTRPILSKSAIITYTTPSLTTTTILKKVILSGIEKIPLADHIVSYFK